MAKHTDIAKELYARIVEQARKEAFYRSCGVPDSVDGRFDSIAVHCFLVLYRIKSEDEKGAALAWQDGRLYATGNRVLFNPAFQQSPGGCMPIRFPAFLICLLIEEGAIKRR